MPVKKLSEYVIDSFDGGVNFRDIISELPKNELSDCVNMYYKGKELKTRKGARICKTFNLTNSDCEIVPIGAISYTNELGYKMFLVTKKESTYYIVKILVVKSDGTCTFLTINKFLFSQYNTTLSKVNCVSFSGKETISGGHYLLLSLYDENEELCEKLIYELSADFSSLSLLKSKDIYKPLVSINGKGDKYSELPNSKKTFPASRRYENFNLLSSGFRSGFTTDGISTTFVLPVNNLSSEIDEDVIVEYTANNGMKYSVQIPYNSSSSTVVDIQGIKYVFKIDKPNGLFFVLNEEGEQTALPMSEANRNNLVITAYKTAKSNILFKMSVVESFNARVFLAGYEEEGNLVYFSRQNNPLYFPESNFTYFGESGSNIVALKQNNDRLLVFKSHQVGVCSSINSSIYDAEYIFNGGTTNKAVVEKITIKTLKTGVGCYYPETIMSCSNRLVFLGSDNRVYAITSSSNYTHRFYRISDKIEPKLNDFENAFSADYDGYYMLFVDNRCFLFDYNTSQFLSVSSANGNKNKRDRVAWFYFEYDFGVAKPMLSIDFDGNSLIIAKGTRANTNDKIFLYDFEGNKDYKILSNLTSSAVDIKSSFSTGASELKKDGRKNIVGVELTITNVDSDSGKITLYYMNENKICKISEIDATKIVDKENVIRKNSCVFGVRHFGIKSECETGFGLKQIKYIYKE